MPPFLNSNTYWLLWRYHTERITRRNTRGLGHLENKKMFVSVNKQPFYMPLCETYFSVAAGVEIILLFKQSQLGT